MADPIGAGDAFMASFVASLVAGRVTTRDMLWLAEACKIGAYVATQSGATPDYDPSAI